MIVVNEDIKKLFNKVHSEISQNVRILMEELWSNWSHLGVDEETKIVHITKLVNIEKDFHKDVISETCYKLQQMEQKIAKLKDETEELSRCLSVDISVIEYKDDMLMVDYKNALEEQLSVYRIQAQQRRMKMDRLLEWQRDLVEKLGVTLHELQEEPLPAEEELNRMKEHLEVLQKERDKRAEIFLNTQVEIKDIMGKLQIKPTNKFEQMAVTSMSVDFKVTDQNMERLAMLRQDLQEKYEQTNNRIKYPQHRDSGIYECQISTTPHMSHFIHLNVVEPTTEIIGGPDLYIDRGSTINLTCVVLYSPEPPAYIFWNHNDAIISYDSPRGGVSVVTEKGETTTSFLLIQQARPSDSGTYQCNPSNAQAKSIVVHVLNGEYPAAMQRGGQAFAPTSLHCVVLAVGLFLALS